LINLSISVNKGISSIVIVRDGKVIFKEVKKVSGNQYVHYTEQYLNLFSKGLFLLKTVSEQERIPHEEDCVMEMKCKQVTNWFKTLNAPRNHSQKFIEALRILDTIPHRYQLVYEKNPIAYYYADEKYIEKERYTSALDLC